MADDSSTPVPSFDWRLIFGDIFDFATDATPKPTVFQTEQGLSSTPAPTGEDLGNYHRERSKTVRSGELDFSKLPKATSDEVMYKFSTMGGRDGHGQDNLRAFLNTIAVAEGTATATNGGTGYDMLVGTDTFRHGSNPEDWQHPNQVIRLNDHLSSSAAGRYQFLHSTWADVARQLNLTNFSPAAQDAAALELVRKAGALDDVLNGNFRTATIKVRGIWASFPGAGYGQHEQTYAKLENAYLHSGGHMDADTATAGIAPPSMTAAAGTVPANLPTTPAVKPSYTVYAGDSLMAGLAREALAADGNGHSIAAGSTGFRPENSGSEGQRLFGRDQMAAIPAASQELAARAQKGEHVRLALLIGRNDAQIVVRPDGSVDPAYADRVRSVAQSLNAAATAGVDVKWLAPLAEPGHGDATTPGSVNWKLAKLGEFYQSVSTTPLVHAYGEKYARADGMGVHMSPTQYAAVVRDTHLTDATPAEAAAPQQTASAGSAAPPGISALKRITDIKDGVASWIHKQIAADDDKPPHKAGTPTNPNYEVLKGDHHAPTVQTAAIKPGKGGPARPDGSVGGLTT